MATTIEINLYPPIMPDVIPAFIRTESCNIYFSLSSYNSLEDIDDVQVIIVNQKTNASAFDLSKYPSGIKIVKNILTSNPIDGYPYHITIDPADLAEGVFGLNQFYKIQLRFTSSQVPEQPPSTGVGIATWLSEYIDYFSEWSTTCLIKGISTPRFTITGFSADRLNTLSTQLGYIVGSMSFTDRQETQYLKSYHITIYKNSISNFNIVYHGEDAYPNQFHLRQINYEINYDLQTNVTYILAIYYTTNNLYQGSVTYRFLISSNTIEPLDINTDFSTDEENGSIRIFLKTNEGALQDYFVIKRSSSETNFRQWKNLKEVNGLDNEQEYVWYDTSIENGIWYKYRIQAVGWNQKYVDSQPLMCVFDDMFLTTGDRQLKIKFNPTVSGLKYNVTESQQVTLGSQFPFIRRNGNNYYRSFAIGGLITSLIDTSEWYEALNGDETVSSFIEPFTSREEIYGDNKQLYDQYNQDNDISYRQDYLYEREFRKKVQEFLYKNNIKLFRSLTEGNILVKLMDINLQPMNELGRCLYSFTANAVEIAESNVENYTKYDIINKQQHKEV